MDKNIEIMRTIKFKGKRVDNGEWVYGNLIFCYNNYWIFDTESGAYTLPTEPESDLNPFRSCFHQVEYETVGVSTGLSDKNGKEVFDRDCVDYGEYQLDEDFNPTEEFSKTGSALVYWDENLHGWSLLDEGQRIPPCHVDEVETTGNIHDQ